jgi:hypothetical protein
VSVAVTMAAGGRWQIEVDSQSGRVTATPAGPSRTSVLTTAGYAAMVTALAALTTTRVEVARDAVMVAGAPLTAPAAIATVLNTDGNVT